MERSQQLTDKVAAFEHEQWCKLTRTLAAKESIHPMRLARWQSFWKPFDDLSEGQKERAREEADKILTLIGL